MSHDWLQELRNKNAYYCRDPETFLKHVQESESRKKYFFLEERATGKVRLWMVVEGISPIIVSFKDFPSQDEAQRWSEERLDDFIEFTPLQIAIGELVS